MVLRAIEKSLWVQLRVIVEGVPSPCRGVLGTAGTGRDPAMWPKRVAIKRNGKNEKSSLHELRNMI